MENAQLISLSRQIALQRQMNVVANNVANMNTTGFKSEQVLFAKYVMPVAKDQGFRAPDQPLIYTQDWTTINDFSAGAIAQTGNDLDVALQGKGFLTVQTPDGERYTRAGALQLNNQGLLVDNNGYAVLGQGGQIRFAPNETDIRFSQDGICASLNSPTRKFWRARETICIPAARPLPPARPRLSRALLKNQTFPACSRSPR